MNEQGPHAGYFICEYVTNKRHTIFCSIIGYYLLVIAYVSGRGTNMPGTGGGIRTVQLRRCFICVRFSWKKFQPENIFSYKILQ